MEDNFEIITKENVISLEYKTHLIKIMKLSERVSKEEKKLKAQLKKAMEERNIYKIKTEEVSIALSPETTQEKFDMEAFKKDHPDLYAKYLKIESKAGSFRITLGKDND